MLLDADGALFVGGLMNMLWIAGLALLVLVEKLTPLGPRLSPLTGVGLIGWGAYRSVDVVRLERFARREFDRLSMRRAQIGALPLVLALVEFRGRDAAVFREQPLERREHGAVVGFAIVGLGA